MSNLISIVLPVHNELLNLRSLIESWNSELKKISSIGYEFVIVEDGSTDGTKELIEELEKNFPIINLSSEKKRGYSQAVLDGIKASNGDYILCTDSENQIKVNSLIKNIKNLPGNDIFLFGSRTPRNDPIHRIIYSKMFKVLHDLLFRSNLSDPSCPFVLGTKETFIKLPQEIYSKWEKDFGEVLLLHQQKWKLNLMKLKLSILKDLREMRDIN